MLRSLVQDSSKSFVSIGEAALTLGVSVTTLRRWEQEGKLIPTYRTYGNHRRYSLQSLNTLIGKNDSNLDVSVGYGRVSGHDQKEDLDRQVSRLNAYLETLDGQSLIITDLGSGLNFKKKGLKQLIQLIIGRQINRLVLTHKDRLLRFGSELIDVLCQHFGVEVVILDDKVPASFEEELATDIITIVTVFSAKLYGKRSHQNRKVKKAA